MDEGDVPTPTKSEFATFQVLANQEFINLNKRFDDEEEQVHVTVVEDLSPTPPKEDETPPYLPTQETIPAEIIVNAMEQTVNEVPNLPDFLPSGFEDSRSTVSRDSERSSQHEEHQETPPKRRPSKNRESTAAEIEAEKEGLLSEIYAMERQGDVKLVRPLSMKDSLEEIQFQYDRMQAEVNATQMVDFAKNAIKMGSGMVEMVLKKSGIKLVDGYHTNLCKDMNKFNRPLNRLYKKYWRRGGMSPEAELGMLVFGSLAWTVVQNKMGSFGQEKEEPPPQPKATKPPPQMSSLNIPASWGAESEDYADTTQLQRESQREMEARLASERDIAERERALRLREERAAELERAELQRQVQRASEELETVGSIDDDVRKISISGTPTRKKGKKKAEVELNLDD